MPRGSTAWQRISIRIGSVWRVGGDLGLPSETMVKMSSDALPALVPVTVKPEDADPTAITGEVPPVSLRWRSAATYFLG